MRPHHLALALSVAVTGCASGQQYVTEAKNLYAQYDGEVGQLLQRNAAVAERASKLSSDTPGLKGLMDQIALNKTHLEGLKNDLGSYPTKIGDAVNAKKMNEAEAMLVKDREMARTYRLGDIADLKRLEGKLTEMEGSSSAAAPAKVEAPAAPAAPPPPARFAKALSTGFNLDGNLNGVEAQLVAFIEDKNRPVDKTTWFNFDRLSFATGKAELDMDKSKAQLVNIVEILKAFPAVKLKLGGYTDNVGKEAANKKLSDERAKNVMGQLVKLGTKADRLAAEGYGPQFPECAANDTEECRAKNRRIAIRVTAK